MLHVTSAAVTSQRALLLALWWRADVTAQFSRWAATNPSASQLIMGDDEPHTVVDATGIAGVTALAELIPAWGTGRHPFIACFPVAGDPCGVPASASADAIMAGECVLGHTPDGMPFAAVPTVAHFGSIIEPGATVTWTITPVDPWLTTMLATVGTVAEASTRLRRSVVEAAAALERLDVASASRAGGPDVAFASPPPLPASIDPAAARLLIDGLRMLSIADAAFAADSAAITARQLDDRRTVVTELHHAARLAISAATLN